MNRRPVLLLLTLAILAGPLAANASGQQRTPPAPDPDPGDRPIPQAMVQTLTVPNYTPAPFEVAGFQFPLLDPAVLVAIREDEQALRFDVGNELGGFAAAPKGGSAFFGQGRPIFGLGAPPILVSGVLRPLGSDVAGDRFLGAPPPISDTSVIPKLGETPDQRRESFAFINGPPPLSDTEPDDGAFPPAETVAADTNGPLPDNVPTSPTTTPRPTGGRPTPSSTTPTTAPPTGTTRPSIPTTIPVPTPTTARRPTTTTTTRRPTTTIRPTTTAPATSTTAPTTTTSPTTTVPPPTVSFVMGNQRDEAAFCLSNNLGGTHNPSCDRLFDLDRIRPGQPHAVSLTLWNAYSNVHAAELRMFADGPCVGGTDGPPPHGTGNLCDGLQLKVERFSSAARTGTPAECLYGCNGTFGGSLTDFADEHASPSDGIEIGKGFEVNEKAYLVITVLLPDTGVTSGGHGNDNRYLARTALMRLTWHMMTA